MHYYFGKPPEGGYVGPRNGAYVGIGNKLQRQQWLNVALLSSMNTS